jgi:hypothetical protein
MAKSQRQGNGKLDKLGEAMTSLVQAQAALVQNQAITQTQIAEYQRQSAERFARIEVILLEHSRILAEFRHMLEALPEAVRDKNGFKTRGSS